MFYLPIAIIATLLLPCLWYQNRLVTPTYGWRCVTYVHDMTASCVCTYCWRRGGRRSRASSGRARRCRGGARAACRTAPGTSSPRRSAARGSSGSSSRDYYSLARAIKQPRPLEATPKLYCERESDRHASVGDVAALLRLGGDIADRARCAPAARPRPASHTSRHSARYGRPVLLFTGLLIVRDLREDDSQSDNSFFRDGPIIMLRLSTVIGYTLFKNYVKFVRTMAS